MLRYSCALLVVCMGQMGGGRDEVDVDLRRGQCGGRVSCEGGGLMSRGESWGEVVLRRR